MWENGKLAAKYTYDKLNRLVREDNKQFGKTTLFTYDNNGNILSKREFAFTLKDTALLEELDSTDTLYAYDGDRLMSFGDELFTYDALGNPLKYRNKVCKWEKGRQLTEFDGTTFTYNGRGWRKTKGNINFIHDVNGNLLRQSNGESALEFIYAGSELIGVKHIVGETTNAYYYRRNAQGDVTALLDSSGKVVVKYVYDAWGNNKVEILDGTPQAAQSTHIGNLNPFRYRGYYYDTETGLYFLKSRYYDPEIGRFITIDDISYLDPDSINGLNLYAYCRNNPVMAVDPEGKLFLSFLIASIVVGAIIGGATSGYKAYKEGARGWNVFGAALGGAIMGGAMGAVMVIGGAAGLASLGIATTVVGGSTLAALGISIGIGVGAGLLSYTAESLIRDDKKFNASDLILSGLLGGFQAATTFGLAFAGGRAGVFTGKLTTMGAVEFLQFVANSTGAISTAQAVVYATQVLFANTISQFLLVSIPATIIRGLMKKLIKG